MLALRFTLLAVLVACPRLGVAAAAGRPALVLADFADQPVARFPDGWKSREDVRVAERVYRVSEENGQHFLHAVADAASVQIALPVSFELRDYPVLSWRWRVEQLPTGADEREAATNDSGAGVYMVFKGRFGGLVPQALKYVWSGRQPAGADFPSPGYSNTRIVVLESGPDTDRSWRTESVNVLADYRRLFGTEPPALQAIAVLTDADNTRTRAVADYGDFRALRTGAAATASPSLIAKPAD